MRICVARKKKTERIARGDIAMTGERWVHGQAMERVEKKYKKCWSRGNGRGKNRAVSTKAPGGDICRKRSRDRRKIDLGGGGLEKRGVYRRKIKDRYITKRRNEREALKETGEKSRARERRRDNERKGWRVNERRREKKKRQCGTGRKVRTETEDLRKTTGERKTTQQRERKSTRPRKRGMKGEEKEKKKRRAEE